MKRSSSACEHGRVRIRRRGNELAVYRTAIVASGLVEAVCWSACGPEASVWHRRRFVRSQWVDIGAGGMAVIAGERDQVTGLATGYAHLAGAAVGGIAPCDLNVIGLDTQS